MDGQSRVSLADKFKAAGQDRRVEEVVAERVASEQLTADPAKEEEAVWDKYIADKKQNGTSAEVTRFFVGSRKGKVYGGG